jgi:hypothetical protein
LVVATVRLADLSSPPVDRVTSQAMFCDRQVGTFSCPLVCQLGGVSHGRAGAGRQGG